MVNNQNEFNKEYNNKEATKIRFKNEDFEEKQLVIEDYPNLEMLYLRGVDKLDKLVLRNLPQLKQCTISDCGVQELVIEDCSQIKELKIPDNSLTNLEFLKNLKNLQKLNVDDNIAIETGLEYLPKSLKNFSCENTKLSYQKEADEDLEVLRKKYENLKGFISSLSKEAQEELVGKLDKGIKAKEEASERGTKEVQTDELVLNLEESMKGMKEVKKELETNLIESEKKVKKLEKELIEAKTRTEERQKKIKELNKEQESETVAQNPLYEKTIEFLRTKSIFLNARQETIAELKRCFITLENKFGKYEVIGEVSNTIGGTGGAFDAVAFGVPRAIGEIIKAGNNFARINLIDRGNKEFQISLADGNELIQLNNAYVSLLKIERFEIDSDFNILGLKDKSRIGKARSFNIDYEILDILAGDGIWKDRKLTPERMEKSIILLGENHKQLESEWEEQFEKLKTKLGKERSSLFYQEQQIRAKSRHLKNQLEELKSSVKDKLKSKYPWSLDEKKKRNKERELMFQALLEAQEKIIRLDDTIGEQKELISLQDELLEIANEHGHKEFKTELDKLCEVQIELTKSQIELESLLQDQQVQVQIPPKGNN